MYLFRIQSGTSMELAPDGARSVSNLASILDWCVESTQAKVTAVHQFPVANFDCSTETSNNAQCQGCKKFSQKYLTIVLSVMISYNISKLWDTPACQLWFDLWPCNCLSLFHQLLILQLISVHCIDGNGVCAVISFIGSR